MEGNSEPIRLAIEVDRNVRPLRGRVISAGGAGRQEFIGWTGLAAALTAIIDQPASADSDTSD